MESGAIPEDSITASSFTGVWHEPYRGRLNGVAGQAAWVSKYDTIGEWLQVDLGEMKRVTGTIIQGRYVADEWVFPGSAGRHIPVTNLLNNPVYARYVRFLPQTWHGRMSMRAEIVGCDTTAVVPTCPYLLGMESGAIPDGSITASSFYGAGSEPYLARLYGVAGGGAWVAEHPHTIGEWLEVFPGSADRNTPVINLLNNEVDARYVRFVVQSWHTMVSMRVEIVGCNTTICSDPLGMESGAIPDDSITASSFHSADLVPYNGRLNGVAGGGAWMAISNTIGQWLQVDLGEMKRVTGTIIQGRRNTEQRVTSYKLQYSTDRITWTTCAGSDGSEMDFAGNVDRSTPVTNLLNNPADARYVRFLPQTWNHVMSMRAEIVGCNTTAVLPCLYLLGMESGAIPDGSITASSVGGLNYVPYRGRLNGVAPGGAWAPLIYSIGQWLQVFAGNVDRNTPVTNLLNNPVDARYVRFLPQTWHHVMAMRVEIVGCNTSLPSVDSLQFSQSVRICLGWNPVPYLMAASLHLRSMMLDMSLTAGG
ncbi:lactadherin-like [Branchiostoma lanceolatum]|uniref:lactadherin-like n=1 Tax=Branchiostoma lanceolatum TaxID=7740 RepID=UPI003454B519